MSATIGPTLQAGCIGLVVAAASAPVVLSVLRHQQIFDVPSARSSHAVATPRGGGLCCLLGVMAALALASPLAPGNRILLAGVACSFAALGFVDDVHPLPVRTRLLLQAAIAAAAAVWLLHHSPQTAMVAGAFGLLAALWIIGYVNVFNFMDGINGLAGTAAVVSGATFAVIGCVRHDVTLGVGGAVAAGAAVGFLPWNFPRPRFFLGDVGSYLFGSWLAVLVVVALLHHVPFEAALAPQAVFLADVGSTLAGRLWRGEDWKAAHRSHVYQRLQQLGGSHVRVTIYLALLMAALAALGATSFGSTMVRSVADIATILLLLAYLLSPRVLRSKHAPAVAPST